ncbi:MAG: Rpn family recombination-promoting nuclease/putative transposase [Saprospiraceae bacterium]|nr:Rpn family recombination-promoting nuclease/putative transposase [Saprospiraceae bacterium]MDW8229676.1 Rpn family recombination-promoting nuclease/putative transposase [Saprospiraceae bacterium]
MPLQDRYVNPLTDFGFKKLFGSEPNKDLLIHFLNQLLPEHHQIQDLTYLSSEKLGFGDDDRRAIFDLYCTSTSGERFIVEVQKAKQKFFRDRSVFYATFPIQEQAKKGEWNFYLDPVYLVAILDFVFDEDRNDPCVLHNIQLKDQDCQVFFDKLTFIYIELPKFNKREEELETTFDKWLYVLKHLPDLQDRPRALQERVFQRLFEAAEIARFNPEERQLYEESLKVYRDLKNVVDTARDEGKEEGRAEGRAEKEREVVLSAYAAGLDLAVIAQVSGMSIEDVRAILREAGHVLSD